MTDPQFVAQQEQLSRTIRELNHTLEEMDPRRTAVRKAAEHALDVYARAGQLTPEDQFSALLRAIGDLEGRLIKLEEARPAS
jgi:hypothetical protein